MKVLDEVNTPIQVRPLNEWEIPGLGHFEVGNFGQKMAHVFDYMVDFLTIWGDRATFKRLKTAKSPSYGIVNLCRYLVLISPYDSLNVKIGIRDQIIDLTTETSCRKDIWTSYCVSEGPIMFPA